MPVAVLALTAGAFGIGTTEFIIMGLLLQVAADMQVTVSTAGLLISGYALGVCAGAPVLTLATRRMPRKAVLLALMAIFTLGNIACALAPDYGTLMAARVLTSLAHGTFFGVGSVVATGLVAPDRRASAISTMFMGLTVATLLGVPFGAWLGLMLGWRAAFWAVAAIGVVAFGVLVVFATVAPLQLRVLEKAGPAGRNLVSSLNIAAFNLGNALGAWLGGVTIDHGPGLAALPLVAAAVTALGLFGALWSLRLDRVAAPLVPCASN